MARRHAWLPMLLIAAVSALVPRRRRAEWRREWEAELRHREVVLERWPSLDAPRRFELLRRSLGSLLDALWLQPKRLEEDMYQDVRFGVRILLRKRGFAAVALAALAVGIGANTAIFSVVQAVLLRQLPYERPDRIVTLWEKRPAHALNQQPLSWADYTDFRDENASFEQLAAYTPVSVALSGGADTEQAAATGVTPNVFDVLGVHPLLGRPLLPADGAADTPEVVISYGLWQQRFGADPSVVGRTVHVDGLARTVVGVMPSSFKFPLASPSELWVPLELSRADRENRRFRSLLAIARLKANVTGAQAAADLEAVSRRMERAFPADNTDVYAELVPLRESVVGDIRPSLLILSGAVALVLLISCANVANLLLTRAMARQKEIALRVALGASRLRLFRQLITESVLLSLLGGGLGLLVAYLGLHLLLVAVPRALSESIPGWDDIRLDPSVLAFTAVVSTVTGLAFGLVPALQACRPEVGPTLKEGGRTSAGVGHQRVRSVLVVSELALALVLLAGAGLLMRSFARLQQVDRGFRENGLLTFQVSLPKARYGEPSRQTAFFSQVLRGIDSLPGVESAGVISDLPLSGSNRNWGLTIEGHPRPPAADSRRTDFRFTSPDYFRAMNIPLEAGRPFTEQDGADGPTVAIINERLAELYFPGENPIGQRVHIGRDDDTFPWHTIVGVVGNVKHTGLGASVGPELYYSVLQDPTDSAAVVVRTVGPPLALVAGVRAQVTAADAEVPIASVKTMESVVSDSIASQRLDMVLLGLFAAVAAALAAVGIYGVMSYLVAQRTHEVGIRMALGAGRLDVLKLVVGHAASLALGGVAVGLAGAIVLTRLMSSLLYGVGPTDPITFAGMTLILFLVALVASFIPARKATRVDPIVALRQE